MDLVTSGSISSTYYYAEDFLGSSRTMVQAGGTAPCFDADFLPFGREKDNITTCTQNDYKFEGKERDAETGNDDFGARYYSSNFGRWLSPDWSSIPEPVPYANLTNPQTLNLYAMVQDNPESFADLDGHVNTPGSASQIITCDVTDEIGCDEPQMGYISSHMLEAAESGWTVDDWARNLNNASQPGDPYALVFTPTVKVAICLKDVVVCQEDAALDVSFTQTLKDGFWGMADALAGKQVGPGTPGEKQASSVNDMLLAGLADEGAAARAGELASLMGKTKDFVTIAVTETKEGMSVVSSSENALRPAVMAALREGEIAAKGAGHAEVTGVNAAREMGLTPTGVAASRGICPSCAGFLGNLGVAALSAFRAIP